MAVLSITVGTADLEELMAVLGGARSANAVTRAVQDTARWATTRVRKDLSKQIGVTERSIRRQMWVTPVRGEVVGGGDGFARSIRVASRVGAIGRDITVRPGVLSPTQLKRGGVSFGKRGRRRTIKGAFLQRMPGVRNPAVFVRSTESPNVLPDEVPGVQRSQRVRQRGTDIPVAKLVVPGISRTMLSARVQDEIQDEGVDYLQGRLAFWLREEIAKIAGQETVTARRRRESRERRAARGRS